MNKYVVPDSYDRFNALLMGCAVVLKAPPILLQRDTIVMYHGLLLSASKAYDQFIYETAAGVRRL